MRKKNIIMVNSIEDKLCLPVYKIQNYMDYYKLCFVDNKENTNNIDDLCYLLPCDTQIYQYLYRDFIIELIPVLDNIYVIKNNDIKKEYNLKYK